MNQLIEWCSFYANIQQVIEILSNEYEKRRLGETSGEKLGKI